MQSQPCSTLSHLHWTLSFPMEQVDRAYAWRVGVVEVIESAATEDLINEAKLDASQ